MPSTKITRVASIGITNAIETLTCSANERKSPPGNSETEPRQGKRRNSLVTALKPLLLSMTFIGISDYWKILENDRSRSFRGRILKVYRITLIVLSVCNVIRFFPAYSSVSGFSGELLNNVLIHGWFLQCTVNSCVSYNIVENPNKLRQFFKLWDKYWTRVNDVWGSCTGDKENAAILKMVRKATVICTATGWMLVLGNTIFFIYTTFISSTKTFDHVITPYSNSHPHAFEMKTVFLIMQLFLTGAWIFTSLIVLLLHLILYYAAKQLSKTMEEMQSKAPTKLQETMELFRQQHTELCDMIEVADDIFQFNVGYSLFTDIFLILILVYNLCWYEEVRSSIVDLFSHFFWLSGLMAMLVALMSVCCIVNNWVSTSQSV